MEGGGNMKREGEGHRETESERRERRGEKVVLEFGMGERERAEKREGESVSALWFRGTREKQQGGKMRKDGAKMKRDGGRGRMEMKSRGGVD